VIKTTIDNSVFKNFLNPGNPAFAYLGSPIDEFYLSNTVIQNSYMVISFMYILFSRVAQLDNVTFENYVASSVPIIPLTFVGSFIVNGMTFTNCT
jgi:hypothetical protein